jgi:hypothetical protein
VVDLSLLCVCGHDRGTHAWTTHECLQDVHLTTSCQCKAFMSPIPNVDTTATRATHDPVSAPAHYTRFPGGVQPIDLLEHLPYNLGAAAKYILRAGHKGDLAEDLRKSIWYLERELKRVAK